MFDRPIYIEHKQILTADENYHGTQLIKSFFGI